LSFRLDKAGTPKQPILLAQVAESADERSFSLFYQRSEISVFQRPNGVCTVER
jgi:hypothetical protein